MLTLLGTECGSASSSWLVWALPDSSKTEAADKVWNPLTPNDLLEVAKADGPDCWNLSVPTAAAAVFCLCARKMCRSALHFLCCVAQLECVPSWISEGTRPHSAVEIGKHWPINRGRTAHCISYKKPNRLGLPLIPADLCKPTRATLIPTVQTAFEVATINIYIRTMDERTVCG